MRIEPQEISDVLKRARAGKLVDNADTTLHFISKTVLHNKLRAVKDAFAKKALHTVAIKANPLTEVLREITAFGFGLEAASFEELTHARAINCPLIGWDSPAKTTCELETVMVEMANVIINCDSLDEAVFCAKQKPQNRLLLRINPQQEGTAHPSMSVGGYRSKFGEPIAMRARIIETLAAHENITGLHVHTSSQTGNLGELAAAVSAVIALACEANQQRKTALTDINIGGGFPVNFGDGETLNIARYAKLLKQECPELFDGTFVMMTEFGRYYHAHSGFSLTQIAQVKRFTNRQVIVAHAGADMFLREAYQPNQWPHKMLLMCDDGTIKPSPVTKTDIAGPLCFGGDFIQKDFAFHEADAGDWLAIQDTGANSIALWSKHCSRAFPKCILYDDSEIRVIRQRDTLEQSIAFWS